jgi:hypothetical protein
MIIAKSNKSVNSLDEGYQLISKFAQPSACRTFD